MRVCLVSLNALPALSEQHKSLYIGGAEVQLAQLAVALARLGHEVTLVVSDAGQPDGAVYAGVRTIKAYKPDAGLPVLRFIHPRWTGMWSALTRADADVYLYSCSGMALGLLAMFCRLHRRRLVYRVASDADCDLRTVLIRSRRDRWLYRYGLHRADAILVQSNAQRLAIKMNFGRGSDVVRGLVEGPMTSDRVSKDIDVLWLANLRPLKRPDLILDVAALLPQYKFHIVGGPVPGEERCYRDTERRARGLSNVTFHGKIPYMDVGRLFDRTKLFVNTSDVEGFPNTFLQAWIRGIPVATMFDPDAIVRREALGSTHDSVADLAAGVTRLLESEEAYAAARTAALRHMRTNFDERSVLDPYLKALHGAEGAPQLPVADAVHASVRDAASMREEACAPDRHPR